MAALVTSRQTLPGCEDAHRHGRRQALARRSLLILPYPTLPHMFYG